MNITLFRRGVFADVMNFEELGIILDLTCTGTHTLNCIQSFVILRTVARQAPLSMGFSRQEYWSGLPFPTPGDLPDQGSNPCLWCLLHWQTDSSPRCHLGLEPVSPASLVLADRFFTTLSHLGRASSVSPQMRTGFLILFLNLKKEPPG